jgi:hypothetical protein
MTALVKASLGCALALGGALFAASCTVTTGTSANGGDASTTTNEDGGSGATASPDIVVAAPSGQWSVDMDVSFHGKGAKDIGAIAIDHGIGTIEIEGTSAQAFLYTHTPVPTGNGDAGAFAGEVDYQIVAAQGNRLVLAWITCSGSDLGWIYYETTDGVKSTMELAASGTCTVAMKPTSETVSLPALDIAPPSLVSGFTITGADLSFDGTNAGTANLAGQAWTMYPFNVVDCATCSKTGWQELHSLFWNKDTQDACAGILYLQANAPTQVELAYMICFPGVSDPLKNDQQFFDATWTAP